jgi:hypothetical protein
MTFLHQFYSGQVSVANISTFDSFLQSDFIIIARLVSGEAIVADDLGVITSRSLGRSVQCRRREVHRVDTESLPSEPIE